MMTRNREIDWLVLAHLAVSGGGIALGLSQSLAAGAVALMMSLALGAVYASFTAWRYRQIRQLSLYLSQVYSGAKPLDIRDNREGELSALKNDLYKITAVLERQAEQLYADKDYLTQALANISHQLKTPLTSLMMMNDFLRNEHLPEKKRQIFLDSSEEQLERIGWLVSALLTLSRIDAEVITFKKEKLLLQTLLEQAAEPLLGMLTVKNVHLLVEGEDNLRWQGDGKWTAEALTNVLKNAVEYSPKGGTVTIKMTENPLHTEIVVTDEGEGIDEKDLPHLFERFYKGRQAQPGSVGIGLALAKTILQSQNGDIFARNAPQGGAQFVIKLYKQVI